MPKKCKVCGHTKEFKDFDKVEGSKKYKTHCRECALMGKLGLNPNPESVSGPSADAEREIRKEQYKKAMARMRSGVGN